MAAEACSDIAVPTACFTAGKVPPLKATAHCQPPTVTGADVRTLGEGGTGGQAGQADVRGTPRGVAGRWRHGVGVSKIGDVCRRVW